MRISFNSHTSQQAGGSRVKMFMALSGALFAFVAIATVPQSAYATVNADSYCSPTGDWCSAVMLSRRGKIISFGTFSFRGSVRVCVRKSGSRKTDCKYLSLRPDVGSLYTASGLYGRDWPLRGHGHFRVSFESDGYRLGRVLEFNT